MLQAKPKAYYQVGLHLVVDSTGLKIFGKGEWLAKKPTFEGQKTEAGIGVEFSTGRLDCAAHVSNEPPEARLQ